MRKQSSYIVLSFLLAFATVDYIWVPLFQGQEHLVMEVETKESKEEIREFEASDNSAPFSLFSGLFLHAESLSLNSGLGHPLKAVLCNFLFANKSSTKLYLLYHQFRFYF